MSYESQLIKIFGVSIKNEKSSVDFLNLNNLALRAGYVVHPDACNKFTEEFIIDQTVNYDSTFYKNWSSILDKSRLELFVDQLIHYHFSYGMDTCIVPNELAEIPEYKSYKIITAISEKEMFNKCWNMVTSKIALSTNTLIPICNYICDYAKKYYEHIDVDKITNREAQTKICDELSITPTEKFGLIRYIFYKTTGETLLINNKETFYLLSSPFPVDDFDFETLNDTQLRNLASIYFRFKYIFLGLRKRSINRINMKQSHNCDVNNIKIINKLRRMANKFHEPMKIGYWESLLSKPQIFPYKELQNRLNNDEIDNFKLITLLQSISERKAIAGGMGPNMYIVRNGKCFIRETESEALNCKYDYWDDIYLILLNKLVSNLSKKACTVKFPKYINLTCPTSEKNFIGGIPFGSYFDMNKNNVIGIYWRGKDGCRDLDLSFSDYFGNKIGWNSSYKDGEDVIYSGDMTIADPDATELLYMSHKCPNGLVKVNLYSGNLNGKYKLFYATQNLDTIKNKLNYMIDPNNIKVQVDLQAAGEQTVGIISDNKMYLMSLITGNNRVSQSNNNDNWDKIIKRKTKCYLDLKPILLAAGFKEYKKGDDKEILDLTDLQTNTLIDLFR